MDWKWFLAGILIVAIAAGFFLVKSNNEPVANTTKEIAAIANGRTIYASDVSKEIARMAAINTNVSRETAANVLVTRTVLMQEAAKQGIVVNGSETQQAFQDFLAKRNITRVQFEGTLSSKNLTLDYFMTVLNQELTVKKLVEAKVPANFIIKYDEVLQLYNKRYNGTNITFDKAEKKLTDELTAVKIEEYKQAYIQGLLSRAEIYIFS
jgi:hypothetical protein